METAALICTNVQRMALFFVFGLISAAVEQVDFAGG